MCGAGRLDPAFVLLHLEEGAGGLCTALLRPCVLHCFLALSQGEKLPRFAGVSVHE